MDVQKILEIIVHILLINRLEYFHMSQNMHINHDYFTFKSDTSSWFSNCVQYYWCVLSSRGQRNVSKFPVKAVYGSCFLLHFMAHLYMSPPRRAEIIVRAPCIRIHATSHCAELVSNRPKSSLRAIWYSKCNQIIRRQFHHTKNLKHTQENLTFAVYRLK